MTTKQNYKPVSYSQTTITELMIPSYANFGGKIHGGIVLSLMDKVAYACAAKHAGSYCVTVSVDNVDFLQPVDVGELLSLHASINFVGRTSLVVGIRVVSENVTNGVVKHTNTSYFTMVAKDEHGKLQPVPGLILETRDDVRRFLEALTRRELKAQYKEHLDNERTNLTVEDDLHKLENEKCMIDPKLNL